jgi:phage head maturation protease
MIEYKSSPAVTQQIDDESRTVTGIAAVTGNVDLGRDRIVRGAFSKTLQERKTRIPYLWQHDMDSPPTATVLELKEIGRADLPADLIREYPDATGGC